MLGGRLESGVDLAVVVPAPGQVAYLVVGQVLGHGPQPRVAAEEVLPGVGARLDRVLLELARIGFSDISNYEVDDDGNVTLVEGADPQAMRAVSTLKRKTRIIPQKNGEPIVEHDVEIKLWDKNTGLANCGKHLGMFAENVNLRTPDGPLQVHITRRIVRPNGDR